MVYILDIVRLPNKENSLSFASFRHLKVVKLDAFGLGNESSLQEQYHKSTYEPAAKAQTLNCRCVCKKNIIMYAASEYNIIIIDRQWPKVDALADLAFFYRSAC